MTIVETEQRITGYKLPSERTYGRKKGHLTPRDEERLARLMPVLDLPAAADRQTLMQSLGAGAGARLWLEIGFGNGVCLAALAARHPQDRFLGLDVFQEGIAALLGRVEREGLDNVRIVAEGVHSVLRSRIPTAALDRVIINFPDPWPKKRHHKRRLVQGPFLDRLADRMTPGGMLTLATDWQNYAEWMLAVLEAHPAFENRTPDPARDGYAPPPEGWVETRFQQKGLAAGRPTWHLLFQRRADADGTVDP